MTGGNKTTMEQYIVTGMSCAACSARVEKAVSKVPGVTSCSVSLLTNSMGVEGTASEQEIIKAVTDAGYGASKKGEGAANGAYLYYPVNEMMAILALESHRNQCAVIGEDLGTVPVEMSDILAKAGVYSYKVFFFETAEDGGYYSPAHYNPQSMSVLCTHDMPTLRGFWNADDLKLGSELGMYPDQQQLAELFDSRLHSKQGILNSVNWHGHLPDSIGRDAQQVPMDSALSEAFQIHLAAGASALLSLQLEDWLEMDKPVNIPGTVDQYPNWRRKLSVNLDEIFIRDNVNQLSKKLTETRAKGA